MAFKPLDNEFVISFSTTASTPVRLFNKDNYGTQTLQARIRIETSNAVLNFGASGVEADNSVSSSQFSGTGNNFTVAANAIEIFGLDKSDEYVSIIAYDGVTDGTAFITIGSGEEI